LNSDVPNPYSGFILRGYLKPCGPSLILRRLLVGGPHAGCEAMQDLLTNVWNVLPLLEGDYATSDCASDLPAAEDETGGV